MTHMQELWDAFVFRPLWTVKLEGHQRLNYLSGLTAAHGYST